jgi:hypothetical protein
MEDWIVPAVVALIVLFNFLRQALGAAKGKRWEQMANQGEPSSPQRRQASPSEGWNQAPQGTPSGQAGPRERTPGTRPTSAAAQEQAWEQQQSSQSNARPQLLQETGAVAAPRAARRGPWASRLAARLRDPEQTRDAIVIKELLDRPVALRDRERGPDGGSG